METLELFDGQPDDVFIDRHTELAAQGPGGFPCGGLPITLLPDQRRSAIEAMSLVSFSVIDKCFVIQFADHEISCSSLRQPISAFHENPPRLIS